MTDVALPFDPLDSTFNRANALYLAHASDVAYCRAPAAAALDRLGLEAFGFRNKITRTRGFLCVCKTHAVLAFRGTEPVTVPNLVTDLVARLVERQDYPGRVHQGFSSVLRRSWGCVENLLTQLGDRPLFLTGHSMGGALAVLTASRLARRGRPAIATYTFGAPRVGDAAFCAGYQLPTYRVVNRLDLIPEMPMASVKILLPESPRFAGHRLLIRLQKLTDRVRCYDHVNTFVYIDRDGVITTDARVGPWHAHAVARVIATRGRSFLEGVTDHLIVNYIRGLEGRVGKRQTGVRRRPHPDKK